MKKILGLDLGVASVGWAMILENEDKKEIVGMGSRIIPLTVDDANEFSAGNAISKNQKRTVKRTQRKGYDRYQLRRHFLREKLSECGMLPGEDLFLLSAVDLYGLRSKALKQQITLEELGRIFFHLNQKRGYKSSKRDQSEDSKDTDYVKEVKDRYSLIRSKGITIGEYFYEGLKSEKHYTIRKQIFPREAYIEEFNAIWEKQNQYYSTVLTEELLVKIRDEIIYYQRPLKSQKGLVSICELEGSYYRTKEGKEVFSGPKVAPRSSPLFQVCKIWETINNLSLKNRTGEEYVISLEKKTEIFDYLNQNERLSLTELFKILGIGRNEGYYANKQIVKGIQGNVTRVQIIRALENSPLNEKLTRFDLTEDGYSEVDITTGEIVQRKRISPEFEKEPLYRLWHLIYSLPDQDQIVRVLMDKFELDAESAQRLSELDFTKAGFGNKSAAAIRKLIPYLAEGRQYNDARMHAGYPVSDSLSETDNLSRKLKPKLSLLKKNSLRQPVVEKILNQMINVVNAIMERYGRPDEIRVELARELKQSKEERNNTFNNYSKRERENKKISERLKEYGLKASRKNIEKWRLYEEIDGDSGKLNGICLYCGQMMSFTKSISGDGVEVEHIIPRARLFDDSFLNKTLAHTACNKEKNNLTAFDFMSKLKSEDEFEQYLMRVEKLYKDQKISKAKRDKLLMPADKIPADFISRQLRETQYISRKSREILLDVCYRVHATSGSVTSYLRHQWGWDDVLMNLHIDDYRKCGLTEFITVKENGKERKKEVIKDWSKRDDHRHHAIDALTVACTSQGIIQRLNKLNQVLEKGNGETSHQALKNEESLKAFVQQQRPFTTGMVQLAVAKVQVSFKAGKRVAVKGRRIVRKNGKKVIAQDNITIPRGALSEESVYGKISKREYHDVKLGPSFTEVDQIADRTIRKIISLRLSQFGNDPSKAFKGLKNNPIWLDDKKDEAISSVKVWRLTSDYVIKYPVQTITEKDLDYIVDKKVSKILRARIEEFNGNAKEAFRDIVKKPIWFNEEKGIAIKTVRLYTGLNSVAPIYINAKEDGEAFVKYVKQGNNHHIAIYEDETGKKHEHVVSFWHAVERKKRDIPVVITNPAQVWDLLTQSDKEDNAFLSNLPADNWKFVLSMQQNEMFVFGMSREEFGEAIKAKDFQAIGSRLFRVRKLSSGNYWFNQQYETQPRESVLDKQCGRSVFASLSSMAGFKIRVNVLGEITIV